MSNPERDEDVIAAKPRARGFDAAQAVALAPHTAWHERHTQGDKQPATHGIRVENDRWHLAWELLILATASSR